MSLYGQDGDELGIEQLRAELDDARTRLAEMSQVCVRLHFKIATLTEQNEHLRTTLDASLAQCDRLLKRLSRIAGISQDPL